MTRSRSGIARVGRERGLRARRHLHLVTRREPRSSWASPRWPTATRPPLRTTTSAAASVASQPRYARRPAGSSSVSAESTTISGPGAPERAAAARGEPLDVGTRVAARPRAEDPLAADQASAHVGVERLRLHAEPGPALRRPSASPSPPRSHYIDLINIDNMKVGARRSADDDTKRTTRRNEDHERDEPPGTPRPQGRDRRRHRARRRPRPRGLLPLPPVLGARARRARARSRTCGTCCSRAGCPSLAERDAFAARGRGAARAPAVAACELLPAHRAQHRTCRSPACAPRSSQLAAARGHAAHVRRRRRHHPRATRCGSAPSTPVLIAALHRLRDRQGADRAATRPQPRGELPLHDRRRGARPRSRPRHRAVPDPRHRPRLQRVDLHRARRRRRPAPTSAPRSWPHSARCRVRCTAARRAARSTRSTRSARPRTPTRGCATPSRNGDRIMGFGHPVYRTADPRSVMLREIAESLGGPLVDFAGQVEGTRREGARRAQARPRAAHQRRVLRRRRDGAVRPPPRAVHADVRRQPGRRLVRARSSSSRTTPRSSARAPATSGPRRPSRCRLPR